MTHHNNRKKLPPPMTHRDAKALNQARILAPPGAVPPVIAPPVISPRAPFSPAIAAVKAKVMDAVAAADSVAQIGAAKLAVGVGVYVARIRQVDQKPPSKPRRKAIDRGMDYE